MSYKLNVLFDGKDTLFINLTINIIFFLRWRFPNNVSMQFYLLNFFDYTNVLRNIFLAYILQPLVLRTGCRNTAKILRTAFLLRHQRYLQRGIIHRRPKRRFYSMVALNFVHRWRRWKNHRRTDLSARQMLNDRQKLRCVSFANWHARNINRWRHDRQTHDREI